MFFSQLKNVFRNCLDAFYCQISLKNEMLKCLGTSIVNFKKISWEIAAKFATSKLQNIRAKIARRKKNLKKNWLKLIFFHTKCKAKRNDFMKFF